MARSGVQLDSQVMLDTPNAHMGRVVAISQRDPRRSPGSSPPRAPSPSSPYAGALGPRKNAVELPEGHSAHLQPPVTAGDFIGKYFAQDSLEFLRWAARYFRDDDVTLCVLLYLMGSQDVGVMPPASSAA